MASGTSPQALECLAKTLLIPLPAVRVGVGVVLDRRMSACSWRTQEEPGASRRCSERFLSLELLSVCIGKTAFLASSDVRRECESQEVILMPRKGFKLITSESCFSKYWDTQFFGAADVLGIFKFRENLMQYKQHFCGVKGICHCNFWLDGSFGEHTWNQSHFSGIIYMSRERYISPLNFISYINNIKTRKRKRINHL